MAKTYGKKLQGPELTKIGNGRVSNQAGKGDKTRPRFVSREQYEKNWDAIFGKKE